MERRRVAAWFAATQGGAVRIICGPSGAGKTFAARQLIRALGSGAAYARVPAGADETQLAAAMACHASAELLVLDEVDGASASAYTRLVDAIVAGEIPLRLVLVGRSRRRLRAETLLARGFARVCDYTALRFDAEEIAQLAAAHGVDYDTEDVAQLLHDTDGWPLAAAWLVRDAAESRRTLRDAFMHWRERNGHLLLEFVERDASEDADAVREFHRALAAGWSDAQHEAERLEQLGLPFIRTRGGLRPYRILSMLAGRTTGAAAVVEQPTRTIPPLMTLNAFGRFRCEIAGKPVTFSRRRDQQVFTYVALAADRRATREHLYDAFWPGQGHAVASQGLRTTLSHIRRAIAQAVPGIDPERYFRTAGEVRVDARMVAVDVHRFLDHLEQGRLDDARGAIEGAKHHYLVARRIYADRLLAAEAASPPLERRAEQLEANYVEVLTRITELHAATGDFEVAREAARTLMECNTEDTSRRALRGIAVQDPAETA
ncbi:MAG TPA: BTAD domain-containing putative transcriptional regulator [Candidatus Elarobacter sp.]